MPPVHDWEDGGAPAGVVGHDWEDESDVVADMVSESGSEENSDSDLEEDAESAVLAEMLELLQNRTIGANHFCTLMYNIGRLQKPEKLKEYGYRPNAPSGHYQRHLDGILGSYRSNEDLYPLQVPGYSPQAIGRTTLNMHMLPATEYFCKAGGGGSS